MTVSALVALRIENAGLKLQLLQAQADKVFAEQRAAIEQARAEVGAPADHLYHVESGTFQAPG